MSFLLRHLADIFLQCTQARKSYGLLPTTTTKLVWVTYRRLMTAKGEQFSYNDSVIYNDFGVVSPNWRKWLE